MDCIRNVVDMGRCFSCGGCVSACPKDAITMLYNENEGFFRPYINDDMCISCGRCRQYCPSLHPSKTSLIGSFTKIFLVHSSNPTVRHWSTSGGVINSFVRYLLNEKKVDCVLLTKHDTDSAIEATAVEITSKNLKIMETEPREFASRYVCVPVLSRIKDLRKKYTSFAVVGTPCQIKALKLQCPDVFGLGVTCSGGMSYLATSTYKKMQKYDEAQMYYRGDGWPGKNSLFNKKGSIEFTHNGSLFEQMFSSQIFKNPGCHSCQDHFAEMADVSFCDFWNAEEQKNEVEGNSCVIIRSSIAAEIFDNMVKKGYVEIAKSLSEEDVINTQIRVLKDKKGNLRETRAYKLYMSFANFIFKHKIYRFFNYDTYKFLCRIYKKCCNTANVNVTVITGREK